MGKRTRTPTNSMVNQILKLFQLPKPERVKGRDGKDYDVIYRYGPEGGAYDNKRLWDLLKLDKMLVSFGKDFGTDTDLLKLKRSELQRILNDAVTDAKSMIRKQCAEQGLTPLMTKVRILSDNKQSMLYIQGYTNDRGECVIGSPNDHGLWALNAIKFNKSFSRNFALGLKVAKTVMGLTIKHELKQRLTAEIGK